MKAFWQKLTIDWPCALGDWLWAVLVVAPAALLDRLTFRLVLRIVLQLALIAVLFMYFQDIASLHLTMLFSFDVTAYLEIATALFFIVARGHAWRAIMATWQSIKLVLQSWSKMLPRFAPRQGRNSSAMRRKTGDIAAKKSDDEIAVWSGKACAIA